MHNSQDSKYQDCDQLEFDSEPNQITRDPISIFTRIREGKKKEHKLLLQKLRKEFPDGFKIGAAASKGDCFFDTVAQGLNELKDKGLIKSGERFNVQSLRKSCANYARRHADQDSWIYNEIIKDASNGSCFYTSKGPFGPIQDPNTKKPIIDSEKTFEKYLGDIQKIVEEIDHPIWGRPEIEGRMISNQYRVSLYCYSVCEQFDEEDDQKITVTKITPGSDSVEVFIEGLDWNKFKIDSSEGVVGIVNYNLHFVPLLSSLKEDIEKSKRVFREEVYGTEYREYDIKKADTDSQPRFSFKAGGSQQGELTTTRLEEFITYFVKEFEAKLHAYHLILEGKIAKAGKFSDTFSEKIGQGVGGAAGGLVGFFLGSPVKGGELGAAAGKAGGRKIGSIIGNEKHTEKVAKLSDLIDLFRKDKTNFRQRLAEAGFDIFQSFEMQFMRVTTAQGPIKAMQLLAQDAVNRAINYIQKEEALIGKAVILGKSKIEPVLRVPVPNSKIKTPGFKIIYKHQSSEENWYTASLYEKVGLVIPIRTKTLSYYEKGDGKSRTDKYGYRRLLKSEIYDKLKYKCSSFSSLTKNGQFTDYPYILNSKDSEKKTKDILKKINLDDKDLEEERITETIKEVKNDIMEEISLLIRQSHKCKEDREILIRIKDNLENLKIDEYLEKFKEYFEEAKRERQEIVQSIEAGREENRENLNQLSKKQDIYHDDNKVEHRKTRTGVERLEEKINKVYEVFVEKKITQIEKSVLFDVRPPVALFTGRKKELDNLHKALQRNHGKDKFTVISQMTSISGLGGIGKTQLARRYAADHGNDYDGNVIWINAEHLNTMESSFMELAKVIGIPKKDINGDDKPIEFIIKEIYQTLIKKKHLFIFDNAEKNDDLNKFLPLRNLSLDDNRPYILITSRNREWEKGIDVINLNELEVNEGVEFVKEGLGIAKEDMSQDQEVEELVKKLQCFPLAIQQAISYIEDQRVTGKFGIDDYLKEYKKKAEDLLNSDVFKGIDKDYARTTFTTWQITIDKIAINEHGKLALEILNTIAYFAPEKIERGLWFADYNIELVKSAVRLLVKYSMVSGEQEQSILNIHRLVQEVTRLKLKEQEKEEEVLTRAIEFINNNFIRVRCKSHITSIWNYASNHDKLIDDFCDYHYNGQFLDINTPLHLLVEEGNDTAINKILKYRKEKNRNTLGEVVNPNGLQTLLQVAIRYDKLNVIKLLLLYGANVDAIDEVVGPYGTSMLRLAAGYGSKDTVEYILREIDIKKIESRYLAKCLYSAVHNNTLDVITFLMDEIGTNISREEEIFDTGLIHHAARLGKLDIIEYLEGFFNYGKDSSGQTPLHYAIRADNLEVVKHFVEKKGANIEDNATCNSYLQGTPLHYAVDSGRLQVVKYLLEKGAEINAGNKYKTTPLCYAALSYDLELIKYLVGKGAEINAQNEFGETPLHYAAWWGELKIVEYLVKEKADIEANAKGGHMHSNVRGTSFIHCITGPGAVEVIEDFAEKKGVNIEDNATCTFYLRGTPLHYAIDSGKLEVVKYLVEKGAEINARNKYKSTPLCYAVLGSDLELIKYLVEKGAEINAQNEFGETPLHYAAWWGELKVVEYLVKEKADIEANAKGGHMHCNAGGGTPLHYAVGNAPANVVKYLVDQGVKTDAKDGEKDTPLASAEYSNICSYFREWYEETIKVLQQQQEVDYTHQVPGDPAQPKECLPVLAQEIEEK